MDTVDSELIVTDKGNACRFDDPERKPDTHATCVDNSSIRVAGVLS